MKLRKMLLISLLMETGCGLRTSSFTRRRLGKKRIVWGMRGKERRYMKWIMLLISLPGNT